jgi:hypothetical protein
VSFASLIRRRRLFLIAPILLAAVGAGIFSRQGSARAGDAEADKAEVNERCALRLSIALLGKSPDAAAMTVADPQAAVDGMLGTPEFADRWARFINSEFNGGPSPSAADDPVYYLAKHIVANDKPWADMFVGPYSVTANAAADGMDVKEDASGVGYFKSLAWQKRNAGNENEGYMLVGAFRILSNTTGLDLVPSIGNPGDDRTDTGRQAPACKGCHFDAWFALDTYAKLLPKRKGMGDTMTFTAPTEGPQKVLGKTIADEKELVTALVDSDPWRFHQCRLVFKFLHGRPENQCEAPVFDKCVDALKDQKTVRAAVSTVAKDGSFCR